MIPAMPKQANFSPFSDYSAYISRLKRLSVESHLATDWNTRVHAALNGQAGAELRLAAPLETRRKFGAFFTGTDLGAKLIGSGTDFGPKSVPQPISFAPRSVPVKNAPNLRLVSKGAASRSSAPA